jgi:hypothetical protein
MRHAISNDMQLSLEAQMPNTANRRNLKALMDLLSDSHCEITALAAEANACLVEADGVDGKRSEFKRKFADRRLESLLGQLAAHELRVRRITDEVTEIKKNIRVI